MTGSDDLLRAVDAFQDALRRHAVGELTAMFTDDAEFELAGMTRLTGKEALAALFEYDAGVNAEIQLSNRTAHGDRVRCQMLEANDRFRVAGLDSYLFPSCELVFREGLICAWRATPDPEPLRPFVRFWEEVRLWIAEHHPADHARLFTAEGGFVRNRSNGERAVELARQYRAGRER